MDWQIHLSNEPINGLQLVNGQPTQLAVWLRQDVVYFFNEPNGAFVSSQRLNIPLDGDLDGLGWRALFESLQAPNGQALPLLDTRHVRLQRSQDGLVGLYQHWDDRLELELDGVRSVLTREGDARWLAVALDRELGTIAGVDEAGALHIYQQHIYLGAFPLPGGPLAARPMLLMPDAAATIFLVDGRRLRVIDLNGQVLHQHTLPEVAGVASCTPDGSLLAVGSREQSVLRVFDEQLNELGVRAAHEVVRRAIQLQLLASPPAVQARLRALTLSNAGALVFALDGVVCCSHLAEWSLLPQPSPLI